MRSDAGQQAGPGERDRAEITPGSAAVARVLPGSLAGDAHQRQAGLSLRIEVSECARQEGGHDSPGVDLAEVVVMRQPTRADQDRRMMHVRHHDRATAWLLLKAVVPPVALGAPRSLSRRRAPVFWFHAR